MSEHNTSQDHHIAQAALEELSSVLAMVEHLKTSAHQAIREPHAAGDQEATALAQGRWHRLIEAAADISDAVEKIREARPETTEAKPREMVILGLGWTTTFAEGRS